MNYCPYMPDECLACKFGYKPSELCLYSSFSSLILSTSVRMSQWKDNFLPQIIKLFQIYDKGRVKHQVGLITHDPVKMTHFISVMRSSLAIEWMPNQGSLLFYLCFFHSPSSFLCLLLHRHYFVFFPVEFPQWLQLFHHPPFPLLGEIFWFFYWWFGVLWILLYIYSSFKSSLLVIYS